VGFLMNLGDLLLGQSLWDYLVAVLALLIGSLALLGGCELD